MKRFITVFCIFLVCLGIQAKVKTFKYSPNVEQSKKYSVEVGGKSQTVLRTQEPDVCIFECDGPVQVTVRCKEGTVSRCDVRPLSLDFNHKFADGAVTLTLKPKDRVVVEFDGDILKPLFIFANEITKKPSGDNVICLKEGEVYNENNLNLKDGQTLYIEGGACLCGNVKTAGASNIRICGSGIIDSRRADPRALSIVRGDNISISGITVLNQRAWCTYIAVCNNIDIENYKVVAEYNLSHKRGLENDALDLISCCNARIRNCLTYCHDDALCLKTSIYNHNGPSRHISYEDCIVWNVRGGNSMEIGFAVNDDIEDVSYKNIYSIHRRVNDRGTHNSDIAIHCAGKGKISNVSYENIYLEETDNYTIDFEIFNNGNCEKTYGYTYTPGGIENVRMKNIFVLYDQPKGSRILGYDENHKIRNVTIDGLYLKGIRATKIEDSMFELVNIENITLL